MFDYIRCNPLWKIESTMKLNLTWKKKEKEDEIQVKEVVC